MSSRLSFTSGQSFVLQRLNICVSVPRCLAPTGLQIPLISWMSLVLRDLGRISQQSRYVSDKKRRSALPEEISTVAIAFSRTNMSLPLKCSSVNRHNSIYLLVLIALNHAIEEKEPGSRYFL